MVGSAIYRHLKVSGDELIIASRDELDLTNQLQVESFFENHKFCFGGKC